MTERIPERPPLTEAQESALRDLCDRYKVQYSADHYHHTFDLPEDYVAGFVGGYEIQATRPTLFIGCSGTGEIHS